MPLQAYKQTGVDDMKFGNSNDVLSDLGIWYKSSGVVSHVLFGAASMYAACRAINCGNVGTYLDDVMKLGNAEEPFAEGVKWFWEVSNLSHCSIPIHVTSLDCIEAHNPRHLRVLHWCLHLQTC